MTALWTDLGWTMLHTLWAGALLGLLAAVARRGVANAPAERRYTAAALAFGLMLLTPLAAFVVVHGASTATGTASVAATLTSSAHAAPVARSGLEHWVGYLPWLWLAGTTAMLLSLLRGVVGVIGLRRDVQPAPGRVQAVAARLAHGLRARADVVVVVSARVSSPLLVGIVRPLIVVPPALLVGLTPQQLELVLLHELAHLLRRDNLVIALQRVGEALLFFHPVTWWLSRWLRLERESCCDALVLRRGDRPEAYVRTLLAVAEGAAPSLSAAMARHDLPQRVSRILGRRERPMPTLGSTTAVSLTLLAGLGVLAGGTHAAPTHDETYPSRAAQPVDAWHHPWFGDGSAITSDCTTCHKVTAAPTAPAHAPWPSRTDAPAPAPTPWPRPTDAASPGPAPAAPSAPTAPGPMGSPAAADGEDDADVRELLTEARRLLDDEQALRDDPRSVHDRLTELLAKASGAGWPEPGGFGSALTPEAPGATWPEPKGFGAPQAAEAPAVTWPEPKGFGAPQSAEAPSAPWPEPGGFGAPQATEAPGATWPEPKGFGAPQSAEAPSAPWPAHDGFGALQAPAATPVPDGFTAPPAPGARPTWPTAPHADMNASCASCHVTTTTPTAPERLIVNAFAPGTRVIRRPTDLAAPGAGRTR